MKKTATARIVTGMLAIGLMIGCSSTLVRNNAEVARVNNQVISRAEFQENYNNTLRMVDLSPETLKNSKYEPMIRMFKKITMQNLILTALVKQEAEKRKLTVSDSELQRAYEMHLAEAGGEKAITEQLKKLNLTKEKFREALKEQILKDKVVNAVAGNRIKVTESEIKAFYEANPSQFDHPEQVRARHILIAADHEQIRKEILGKKKGISSKEAEQELQAIAADKRKRAQQLLAEAKAHPERFEALAQKNSDDIGSAGKGGDLGYFSREVMVPPFSKAAFLTKPGQIHDAPVETQFGYHIIQVLDHRAPQKKGFDEVKGEISRFLSNNRKSQIMESWLEEQKRKAKIDITPEYDFEKQSQQSAKAEKSGDAAKSGVQ